MYILDLLLSTSFQYALFLSSFPAETPLFRFPILKNGESVQSGTYLNVSFWLHHDWRLTRLSTYRVNLKHVFKLHTRIRISGLRINRIRQLVLFVFEYFVFIEHTFPQTRTNRSNFLGARKSVGGDIKLIGLDIKRSTSEKFICLLFSKESKSGIFRGYKNS